MYDFSHSLGLGDNANVVMLEDGNLAISVLSDKEYLAGTIVKLTDDKEVAEVTAHDDIPFGLVVTSSMKDGVFKVTIQTPFQAIVKGVASGNLTYGTKVTASSLDATTSRMVYVENTGTDVAVGTVLVGGVDTEEVLIGILKSF